MRRMYTLKELAEIGPDFWADKSIHELAAYLQDTVMRAKPSDIATLPKHQIMLAAIAERLFALTNAEMLSSIYYFVMDAQTTGNISRGALGEKYLQLSAIINHHLKSSEVAANCASLLHDVYELNIPRDTHHSQLFRKLALINYEQLPNMRDAITYHQQQLRSPSITLPHLLTTVEAQLHSHLSEQAYFVQSTALRTLYRNLKEINQTATIAGNHFSYFEMPTLENSVVEASLVMRFLNKNFFADMDEKDVKAMLKLDKLFPGNVFGLVELLGRHEKLWESKSLDIRKPIEDYIQATQLEAIKANARQLLK